MKVLIIGGTRFQGRYLVKELLEAGHTVTVFHLGNHVIDPHNRLTDITGNRNESTDLAQLAGQVFDACIDTCAYFPMQISLIAENFIINHYCLISSVFAYEDKDELLVENSALLRISGSIPTLLTTKNYGALKAMCEDAALARFGERCLIIRPSIIIGAGDHTERLLFWMRLASIHGKHLDIRNRNPVLQLVDVRDLALFTVRCIEKVKHGTINVCGDPTSLSVLLGSIASITERKLESKSLPVEDLYRVGIDNLPYYDNHNIARYSTALSKEMGFAGRELRDSIKDIFIYSKNKGFTMRNFKSEEIAVLRLFS